MIEYLACVNLWVQSQALQKKSTRMSKERGRKRNKENVSVVCRKNLMFMSKPIFLKELVSVLAAFY